MQHALVNINKRGLLGEGIAWSLPPGWLAPLHSSFLWLLQEEEGVSFDTSKHWSAVGAGDPVLRYLEPSPKVSSWTQQQQGSVSPTSSSEGVRLVEIIYK